MAQSLAEVRPQAAIDVLHQGFGVLERLVRAAETKEGGEAQRDQFVNDHSASSLAGSLLPAAERIDPALVPEFFWRAVSFRLPGPGDDDQFALTERSNAALAMTLARYDRRVAGALLEQLAKKRSSWPAYTSETFLAAYALVDPERAVELIEGLPASDERTHAALVVVGVLTREGDSLWRKLQERLGLWSIDVEDL